MENFKAILEAGGATFNDVVKVSIFVNRPGRLRQGERELRAVTSECTAGTRDGAWAALPAGLGS